MKYPQLVSMPSEISDWLDEQLEARGIDAVVYTRYILSLLHRDSVDVVCPDQDLHFTQLNKEVRRSGSGHKRFRCFSEWRDHAQVDAEQLKRSAAIECLISASDQNCGIESLVDELCEKLNKVKNDAPPTTNNITDTSVSSENIQSISPQDLARQYYAAFPPLSQTNAPPGTPTSIVTWKWFSSPKKKAARRQNRSASFDEKLHHKIETDTMKSRGNAKQRVGYFSRSRNDLGYSRSMAKSVERSESMTDWDLFMFSNSYSKNKLANSSGSSSNNNSTSNNSDMFGNIKEEKQKVEEVIKAKLDEGGGISIWNDEESMNICEDLPVDILELLDSPSPQEYTVEMMNLANMRDGGGNKSFIHCGTNITNSIWSVNAVIDDSAVFDNTFNTVLDVDHSETLLGIKFKSLTVGSKSMEQIWANSDVAENETNMFYESYNSNKTALLNSNNRDNCFVNDGFSLSNSWEPPVGMMEKFEKWSEAEFFDDRERKCSDPCNEQHFRNVTKSFIKLNHNREESSFIEVMPKSNSSAFNFFNKASNVLQILNSTKNKENGEKEENLLTSVHSHFKPINSMRGSSENQVQKTYADGTSFVISANWDNPNYKRSDSGSQYLESDIGSPRKLLDYKNIVDKQGRAALVLKFFVRQNDKACQTDNVDNLKQIELDNPQEVPCKKLVMSEPEDFFFPGDEEFLMDETKQCNCTCQLAINKSAMNMDFSFVDDLANCPKHATPRPGSVLAEMWKGESAKQCDKCKNRSRAWTETQTATNWNKSESMESIWQLDKESLQNIWNGGEVCSSCLGLNENGGRPALSSQQSQLREDISQDGEQLLSDLSVLQKSYMEQLPLTEITYDISELIGGNKERKRRHSPILDSGKNAVPVHRGSWNIASHMKQDRLMQMTAVNVLHSVTL